MELQDLQKITLLLVLVGLVVGAGVLVLDKFGYASRDSTTVTNEEITTSSGTATLANTDYVTLTNFYNATNASKGQSAFTDGQVSVSSAGVITVNDTLYPDGDYNVSYTYLAETEATTASTASATAIGGIASNWMGLLVTIVVLSIIMLLVIRSFGRGR